jgi:hypothetical protein
MNERTGPVSKEHMCQQPLSAHTHSMQQRALTLKSLDDVQVLWLRR